jgi:hypothetical protein
MANLEKTFIDGIAKMNNYRGSKKRLFILLTAFTMLVYNFLYGDEMVIMLSFLVSPMLLLSMYDYWRNIE